MKKIIVVAFPETTDISALLSGKAVSVSDGTTTVAGGTIYLGQDGLYEPPATLPNHTHPVTGETGAPQ